MYWWMIATVAAFFVKGLCGFANTLVFTTILSFHDNNIVISPVELLLGFPTNLVLAWRERRHIRWEVCVPLILLVLAGSIPGILFLKNADTGAVKILFGFLIAAVGAEMLLRETKAAKAKQSRARMVVLGVLSGVLCGLYGVGALLGAYIGRVTDDIHAFKANICVVFLAENIFRIVFYTMWGILTVPIFVQAMKLMPAVALGLFLGMASGRVLDERIVRRLVVVLLILSGIALIINNV